MYDMTGPCKMATFKPRIGDSSFVETKNSRGLKYESGCLTYSLDELGHSGEVKRQPKKERHR